MGKAGVNILGIFRNYFLFFKFFLKNFYFFIKDKTKQKFRFVLFMVRDFLNQNKSVISVLFLFTLLFFLMRYIYIRTSGIDFLFIDYLQNLFKNLFNNLFKNPFVLLV